MPISVPDRAAANAAPIGTPTVSVVLPAYNEEAGLAVVLGRLRDVLDDSYEIVVVDDGSSDMTASVAAAHDCRLIRHETNRGKGAALQTALDHVRGEYVVFVDADDTYPCEAIPLMVRALETNDMVIGVRQSGRFNISPVNRVGNAFFRALISIAAGRHVADPLTGLYALRRGLLERIAIRSQGFGIEAEIVIKAGRAGARIQEIPVDYRPRIGESKLRPLRDGMVITRTIWRVAHSQLPD